MFDKANEALKNWKSLLPMLKPFVRSETKTAVRRKKMNVTTAPNGAVIGVTDPVDNTEISIPYQPACATVLVGQSVWVEWLYDNFSTAIAVAPGSGMLPSSFFAYDSNGVRRASVSDSGNVSVYDANGTRRFLIQSEDSSGHNKISAYASDGSTSWQLFGDGTSTANPLPINQGGTGATSASAARTALGISYSELGTVTVANGGTGRTTLTENRVLVGNGTSNVSLIRSQNGAFYSIAQDGAPVFGTLPIAQGGTGDSQTKTLSASTTATVGNISVSARQWGNVVSVILTCSNGSNISAMNYFVRGSISGVTFPANTTVATVFSSGDLCACSINSSGTITARVMVGTVSANTNRIFQFTYLV